MKLVGLAVIIGVALWSGIAHAQPSALVFEGNATTRDAKLAIAAATETLSAAAWKMGDAGFTPKDAKAMSACMASATRALCVDAIIKKKKVARVAILSLETHRTSQGEDELIVSARLLVPADNTFAFDQRYCSHCTDDTVASTTKALMQSLLAQLAQDRNRTVLAVNSEPASAGVFVDDQTAGVTDLKMNISPGPHKVRIERQGYKTELRNVTGVEGKTVTIMVKLAPAVAAVATTAGAAKVAPATVPARIAPTAEVAALPSQPNQDSRTASHSTLAPKLLVGFGGAAIISGGVLMLLNEKDPVAPRGEPQPRTYRTTLLPGGILMGTGLLAAAIGSYLLLRDSNAATTPLVAPVDGGAVVGLIHGF
ncbi:MAG: PEGA domain-containing protein [Kofleriaceae bacterium]|nr:PEGA domain-containing protein [Kofleriaceae bacterium]